MAASRNHDSTTAGKVLNVYDSGTEVLPDIPAPAVEMNNKRSIITQETDMQISTYQASTIDQKPIFDSSPKLKEISMKIGTPEDAVDLVRTAGEKAYELVMQFMNKKLGNNAAKYVLNI